MFDTFYDVRKHSMQTLEPPEEWHELFVELGGLLDNDATDMFYAFWDLTKKHIEEVRQDAYETGVADALAFVDFLQTNNFHGR